MRRHGILRYPVDAIPVGIVLSATVLAFVPFVFRLPLWGVGLVWLGVTYLRTFTAFIQHNHCHLPVFRATILNRLFDVVLAQNTSYASALWQLHHNCGHHRHFLDPENDVARLTYPGTTVTMPRWRYALRGMLTIHRDAIRIGLAERRAGDAALLTKLVVELTIQITVSVALLAFRPWLTVAFFLGPYVASSFGIWWEAYTHHLEMPATSL